MSNKVKFGLERVHYAPITVADGVETIGTPVALPGAVNLTIDPDGDEEVFYADNIKYYVSRANNGYTGSLELAIIPTHFRTAILGEVKNADGVLIESADDKQTDFVLLHEIAGDQNATRFAFYRCSASRPTVAENTTAATKSPTTETFDFTAMPRMKDKIVKATADIDAEPYETWFTEVYDPAPAAGGEGG